MAMSVEVVPFAGWKRVLRLSNGEAELLATLEVGPRVLSYAAAGAPSPFHIFPDQAGGTGEKEWRNRGGHRLWLSPESRAFSYHPDNDPVAWEKLGQWGVRLTSPPEATGFAKEIDLTLEPAGSRVFIVHRITRTGAAPHAVAPWALTVLAPGGTAVVPQPPLGEHPRDLLPNRRWMLWPYTDLGDRRYRIGPRFVSLRQDPAGSPTKLGLAHAEGWAGYLRQGVFFVKRFARQAGAAYPDDGCNLEIFTNARMLELESLGPLVTLRSGESVEHRESWELHAGVAGGPDFTDGELDEAARRVRPAP